MNSPSHPDVDDRSAYHSNNQIAMLEAIKDAGTDGIAVTNLYGPYGQQSDVLEHLLSALIVDYVSLEWADSQHSRGRVQAKEKLHSTHQEQLNITTDPSLLFDQPESMTP